jgi:hypothetical protein
MYPWLRIARRSNSAVRAVAPGLASTPRNSFQNGLKRAEGPARRPMEYKVIIVNQKLLEAELNVHARNGWRVVSVSFRTPEQDFVVVLERQEKR